MVTSIAPTNPTPPAVATASGGNLYEASRQWASRPADERFSSLETLHAHCKKFRDGAAESDEVDLNALRVRRVAGQDLELVGPTGNSARFSNWSFGQLSRLIGAPSAYLSTLPADIASTAMNHGLAQADGDRKAKLLLYRNGGPSTVRAINGTIYDRIWNCDVTQRLFSLRDDHGWVVPPARPCEDGQPGSRIATKEDCIEQPGFGLAIKPGDTIAPAGLYASDRDLFAFLVNPDRVIDVGGAHLFRGVFITNSEVGDKSFRITKFLFNNVCGNHIVWGVSSVMKITIPHIGDANGKAWRGIHAEIEKYSHASGAEERAKIGVASRFMLGKNKDEALDKLFGLGISSRKTLERGAELAKEYVEIDAPGCSPWSAWGFAQGLTRHSQELKYADARTDVDVAAGKVIKVAF